MSLRLLRDNIQRVLNSLGKEQRVDRILLLKWERELRLINCSSCLTKIEWLLSGSKA
jgi:hypothetical protein